MTDNQKYRLYFLIAIVLAGIVVVLPTFMRGSLPEWWPGRPIRLGLDLRGGSYFVLRVQTPEAVKSHLTTFATNLRSEMRRNKVAVIRARQIGEKGLEVILLNDQGVDPVENYVRKSEPGLQRTQSAPTEGGYRVEYQLNIPRSNEIEQEAVLQAIEVVRRRVDQYGVAEPTIQRSGADRILVQLPDITDLETVKSTIGKLAKLEFRMVADPAKGTGDTVELRRKEGGLLRVEDQARLSGREIKSARVEIDQTTHETGVSIEFNPYGAETFDRLTGDNVGRRLAIVLDDTVYSDPVIRERIGQGRASVTGRFSKEEAHQLAVVLRSGALPAPLSFEEQRIVGASLGADSIRSGVLASIVGAVLVVGFMVMYYRKSGVQAIVCTVVNMILLLAALSLFGGTLTLPGIGGLALTFGMAVDSNVIIFERIREELRAGATVKGAIDAGFHKAHWTILDSNLTTLLTGVILYSMGTGPIRGFAVTLSIGVICTIFAALYVSKLGYEIVDMRDSKGGLSI